MPDHGFLILSLQVLRALHAAAHEAGEKAEAGIRMLGIWIKAGIVIAVGWPLVMVFVAMLFHKSALFIMPCLALVPLVYFLLFILAMDARNVGVGTVGLFGIDVLRDALRDISGHHPLRDTTLHFLPDLKEWTNRLKAIVVGELVLGVYLAFIRPEGNLVPLFIILALIATMGRGFLMKWVVGVGGCLALTFVFYQANPPAWAAVTPSIIPSDMPPGYSSSPCPGDGANFYDPKKNEDVAGVNFVLESGCLHGPVILPQDTLTYKAFIGVPQGDPSSTPIGTPTSVMGDPSEWIVIQCEGRAPSKAVHWTPIQDGELEGIMDNCHRPKAEAVSFRGEGKGPFEIYIVSRKQ